MRGTEIDRLIILIPIWQAKAKQKTIETSPDAESLGLCVPESRETDGKPTGITSRA